MNKSNIIKNLILARAKFDPDSDIGRAIGFSIEIIKKNPNGDSKCLS